MKVSELINILKCADPDLEVGIAYDYGDRVSTIVVEEITETEEETVIYSSYHNRHKVIDTEDYERDELCDLLKDGTLKKRFILAG